MAAMAPLDADGLDAASIAGQTKPGLEPLSWELAMAALSALQAHGRQIRELKALVEQLGEEIRRLQR